MSATITKDNDKTVLSKTQQDLTPGTMLRNAREAKGLTAEEVCQELGLVSCYLRALESDDHKILRAPAYVRGYIRRYCALLDINAADVLASYEKFQNTQGEAIEGADCTTATKPIKPMPISVQMSLLQKLKVSNWTFPLGLCVLALALALLLPVSSNNPSAEEIASKTAIKGKETLVISLEKPVWVEVTDARGDILAADFASAGSRLQLSGTAPFQLKLDNAIGVNVSYQQQPIHLDVNSRDNSVQMEVGG